MMAYVGVEHSSTILTSALDGGDQLHAPVTLPSGKEPGVWSGLRGWVGRRAGPDAVDKKKILPLPGIGPRRSNL
jgi:hypothetical protein